MILGVRTIELDTTAILAVLDNTFIYASDKSGNNLLSTCDIHQTRSVNTEILHYTILANKVEQTMLCLPIEEGVSLSIECTLKLLDRSPLLHLCHIDIAFKADMALLVTPLGDILSTVHSFCKCSKLLCIADTSCIYGNHRKQEYKKH